MLHLRRRDFIALFDSAAVATLVARGTRGRWRGALSLYRLWQMKRHSFNL